MENSLLVFIMFQTALYDHKGKKRRSFNPYAYDWKDTVTRTPAHFNPRAWGKAPKGATVCVRYTETMSMVFQSTRMGQSPKGRDKRAR